MIEILYLTAVIQVVVICDALRDRWIRHRTVSWIQWHIVKWISFYSLMGAGILYFWDWTYWWYWPCIAFLDRLLWKFIYNYEV